MALTFTQHHIHYVKRHFTFQPLATVQMLEAVIPLTCWKVNLRWPSIGCRQIQTTQWNNLDLILMTVAQPQPCSPSPSATAIIPLFEGNHCPDTSSALWGQSKSHCLRPFSFYPLPYPGSGEARSQITGTLLKFMCSEANLSKPLTHEITYRNDPKFSDRYAWANSADPDQTVWSGSTLFAIPSASSGLITPW